jgi:hypothetical protein
MPRKEALKKIRQTLKKREAYDPTGNKTSTYVSNLDGPIARVLENLKSTFIQVWLLYVFVVTIACIIAFDY